MQSLKNVVGERQKHGDKAPLLQEDIAWIQGLLHQHNKCDLFSQQFCPGSLHTRHSEYSLNLECEN